MPPAELSRISVPQVENWNTVKDNITRAIQVALRDALPDSKDAARKAAIEKELLEWRDRMFAFAAPNLRVNGQNFEDYAEKPKFLPFDEALDRTVRALHEQALVSEQTIAERRRTVPYKVQELFADLLEREREAEMPLAPHVDDSVTLDADLSFIERHQELEEETKATQDAAQRLNTTVPHLLQRAQWAESVSAELIP